MLGSSSLKMSSDCWWLTCCSCLIEKNDNSQCCEKMWNQFFLEFQQNPFGGVIDVGIMSGFSPCCYPGSIPCRRNAKLGDSRNAVETTVLEMFDSPQVICGVMPWGCYPTWKRSGWDGCLQSISKFQTAFVGFQGSEDTSYHTLSLAPLPGCHRDHQIYYTFRLGNPNLNDYLPLASWERGHTQGHGSWHSKAKKTSYWFYWGFLYAHGFLVVDRIKWWIFVAWTLPIGVWLCFSFQSLMFFSQLDSTTFCGGLQMMFFFFKTLHLPLLLGKGFQPKVYYYSPQKCFPKSNFFNNGNVFLLVGYFRWLFWTKNNSDSVESKDLYCRCDVTTWLGTCTTPLLFNNGTWKCAPLGIRLGNHPFSTSQGIFLENLTQLMVKWLGVQWFGSQIRGTQTTNLHPLKTKMKPTKKLVVLGSMELSFSVWWYFQVPEVGFRICTIFVDLTKLIGRFCRKVSKRMWSHCALATCDPYLPILLMPFLGWWFSRDLLERYVEPLFNGPWKNCCGSVTKRSVIRRFRDGITLFLPSWQFLEHQWERLTDNINGQFVHHVVH